MRAADAPEGAPARNSPVGVAGARVHPNLARIPRAFFYARPAQLGHFSDRDCPFLTGFVIVAAKPPRFSNVASFKLRGVLDRAIVDSTGVYKQN